jgi:DnaJ-class molecular chaperone
MRIIRIVKFRFCSNNGVGNFYNFKGKCLYQIMGVNKDATEEEIK